MSATCCHLVSAPHASKDDGLLEGSTATVASCDQPARSQLACSAMEENLPHRPSAGPRLFDGMDSVGLPAAMGKEPRPSVCQLLGSLLGVSRPLHCVLGMATVCLPLMPLVRLHDLSLWAANVHWTMELAWAPLHADCSSAQSVQHRLVAWQAADPRRSPAGLNLSPPPCSFLGHAWLRRHPKVGHPDQRSRFLNGAFDVLLQNVHGVAVPSEPTPPSALGCPSLDGPLS
mmetsp:Transcript_41395/g.74970  ORF Transcript_41395/g.74970 Transcript_41395/m.74970 type:complete len:230 (+) Transcript_41395:1471-2160(+)